MAVVPEELQLLIRAVLASKDGGVLEDRFRSDFKRVANTSLDFRKLGFRSMKQLMQSIPEVARIEFDQKNGMDRYIGVPKPGQFLSKPAQKAMRLGDSSGDSDEAKKEGKRSKTRYRNRGGGRGAPGGGAQGRGGGAEQGGGGGGDALPQFDESEPLTKEQALKKALIGSANDKGLFALCFRSTALAEFGEETIKRDLNSVGRVVEESKAGSYCFVRYGSLAEAAATIDAWTDKYDLRVPADRNRLKRESGHPYQSGPQSGHPYQSGPQSGHPYQSGPGSTSGGSVTSSGRGRGDRRSVGRGGGISGARNSLTRPARPDPKMPTATDHDLDPSLPIICMRNLPTDTRAHILMDEFGIPKDLGINLFSKKFKQSIAFVAFPNADGHGEQRAREFLRRYQGYVYAGQPIALSIVSGVMSPDDTLTSESQDTISMESLKSAMEDLETRSQTSDTSTNPRTIADDDPAIVCQARFTCYGQPDGAESDVYGPPGLTDDSYGPPGITDDSYGPPGITTDDSYGPPGLTDATDDDFSVYGPSDLGLSLGLDDDAGSVSTISTVNTLSDLTISLKISDFPYETTTEELLTILRPFGVDKVRIINNQDLYHITKALVFVSLHQAHRIIQALDNSTFKNRVLHVAPDDRSKSRMLEYAKTADPHAFPEVIPPLFQVPKLEQLMRECGTFKFLEGSIDVATRMAIYVTYIERENKDYLWAVKTCDYASVKAMDNSLAHFTSDRLSVAQRGIVKDSTGLWHRVWVHLILPDDYLYVVSVDRGRPFTVRRSDYYFLPDGQWTQTPYVIPMKICERRRTDLEIVANDGIYHVQPVDLIDNVLYVAV